MSDPWKGLPKVLRIIGKRYQVQILDRVDEQDSWGEHELGEQLLKAKREQGFEAARDTLLHEALHGIEDQLNLNLKEQQVHQIATGLLAVLRDNPTFARWLIAREPKAQPKKG